MIRTEEAVDQMKDIIKKKKRKDITTLTVIAVIAVAVIRNVKFY
jgi:hypothetical protein